ncbi:MAG: hypothetical protein OEP52_11910 [Acidimicrobiia bacterium]|nr:hypothetical protein [Acidimicrobiia bacterium]
MSWWTRIKAILRREAADVKEGLSKVGKSLDAELARKERAQAATPEERIDMILQEQQADDARFEELEAKVRGESAQAESIEEVAGEESAPASDA